MKQLVFASHNEGKVKELRSLLKDFPIEVLSLHDIGFHDEIIEDGDTFEANALIKVRAIAKHFDGLILADDSGLQIDALDGAPGVYSARYAGEGATDDENIEKVLEDMTSVTNRTARFICVLAFFDGQKEHIVQGTCEGFITTEKKGSKGFGYDPIFQIPESNKTMAQLDAEEKNAISHRGDALKKLLLLLEEALQI